MDGTYSRLHRLVVLKSVNRSMSLLIRSVKANERKLLVTNVNVVKSEVDPNTEFG